ncbi:hypothetical protein DSO57_1024061 [Entomophthora muscae]|uniref:Uncharacterized protein n=1 Tax=Entomophthora muscae TaxID=34485 RepID=A0ACC2RTS7_9FUNG|nr:hypothetical protein DSO57_1024061 [Entomophthora muscae]
MTPPLTLQLNRLQESITANESTSAQIFGVIYITLTSLIDSMVPASGPRALLGKFLSYIVKTCGPSYCEFPRPPLQAGSLTHVDSSDRLDSFQVL